MQKKAQSIEKQLHSKEKKKYFSLGNNQFESIESLFNQQNQGQLNLESVFKDNEYYLRDGKKLQPKKALLKKKSTQPSETKTSKASDVLTTDGSQSLEKSQVSNNS